MIRRKVIPANAGGGAIIARRALLHAWQVMEHYDAAGEPLLQYFELWMDASRVMQRELGENGQVYARWPCLAILIEDNENKEDWLKLYLDDETGFVLFCEAPLFRLRAALLEALPADEGLLAFLLLLSINLPALGEATSPISSGIVNKTTQIHWG